MYGLIGKMTAVPGKRGELAAILLEGTRTMPGCLSYVVATDPDDTDALWITEVWDSQQSHQASLALPAVQDAIARGRPLIAGSVTAWRRSRWVASDSRRMGRRDRPSDLATPAPHGDDHSYP